MENITAEAMRKLASENKAEVNQVLADIHISARKNKMSMSVAGHLSDFTVKELQSRGFDVTYGNNYKDLYTTIQWK